VQNYRDTLAADAGLAKRFTNLLRGHGVFKSESKIYVSLAHDDADIAHSVAAFANAAQDLAAAR
jgi:glutamate-1-semialdehyde 2,1-aminomutase